MDNAQPLEVVRQITPPPKPGIYHGMKFRQYREARAANWSLLKHDTAEEMRRYLTTKHEPATGETRLGWFLHAYIIEDYDRLKDRLVVVDEVRADLPGWAKGRGRALTTGSLAETWEEADRQAKETHGPQAIVIASDWEQIAKKIMFQILRNETAAAIIEGRKAEEVSMFWLDPTTNLPCKGRIDILHDRGVFDLKTTGRGVKEWERSVVDFGYVEQLAHYGRGLEVLGEPPASLGLIMLQTCEPYTVQVRPIDAEYVRIARLRVAEKLRILAEAWVTNEWRGHPDEVPLYPPKWLEAEYRHQREEGDL